MTQAPLFFRPLFSGPKTVQASVTLLEQLPVYSERSGSGVLYHDILPMLYLALESSMSQVRKTYIYGPIQIGLKLIRNGKKVHRSHL